MKKGNNERERVRLTKKTNDKREEVTRVGMKGKMVVITWELQK